METRREFTGLLVAALAGASAGCTDLLFGEGDVELTGTPAKVPESVLAETGYVFAKEETVEIEKEFEVGDNTRRVLVTGYYTQYMKELSLPNGDSLPAAGFGIVSIPQVEILGETFDPLDSFDPEELLNFVREAGAQGGEESPMEQLEEIEVESQQTVTVAGQDTQETKFRGTVDHEEGEMDFFVHLTTAVELGEGLAYTIGGYPAEATSEEGAIRDLMGAVEVDD